MNSFPLSPLVISWLSPVLISWLTQFYREYYCLQILRNSVALNSYLGLAVLSNFFFDLDINFAEHGKA